MHNSTRNKKKFFLSPVFLSFFIKTRTRLKIVLKIWNNFKFVLCFFEFNKLLGIGVNSKNSSFFEFFKFILCYHSLGQNSNTKKQKNIEIFEFFEFWVMVSNSNSKIVQVWVRNQNSNSTQNFEFKTHISLISRHPHQWQQHQHQPPQQHHHTNLQAVTTRTM